MTGDELDSAMRYFSASFARWPQANSPEVLVVYGQRIGWAKHFDVCQAIDELAEGCTQFPAVAELVEAVRTIAKRNAPAEAPRPKLAAPRELPIVAFVRSMRDAGDKRPVRANEIHAFRMLRKANLPAGASAVGHMARADVQRFTEFGTPASALSESYGSVSEFLAHEGYATG